jgi:AcrR family transcriptional regulator
MGPVNSATWSLLLDGAESILKEEGYASLTSRRVAERVNIKQQLVYYYFRTMDELMVEAFRRLAKRDITRLEEALNSEKPLHELWNYASHPGDARLISEFMALAHRSKGIRREVIDFIERTRRMQVNALSKAMKGSKSKSAIMALKPVAITLLANSAALSLTREASLGISSGHAEVNRLIEECLSTLEPSAPKRRSAK